MIFTVDDENP